MRSIVTALTATTLAIGLLLQAAPASAAGEYDSAYAGESAFLSLTQGDLGTFTVFFVNTGTNTWTRGTSTQVDLAVCLENKTTCDVSNPATADFKNGWLSSTRYATHTQTSVAPGQAATYTYSIRVPLTAATTTYTFNGALVVSATGADVHNEGYYQQATVAQLTQKATITSLSPTSGSTGGGDNVVVTGGGFVCSPTLPTVKFGTKTASVLSCGATSLTAVSPAATAAGDVDVTVTNNGASASNALTFTYEDTTAPTFDSVSVESQTVTLHFSEPICANATLGSSDLTIKVNGGSVTWTASTLTAPACSTDSPDDSFDVQISTGSATIVEGDTVSVTITSTGADKIEDAAGNTMARGQTRSTTAAADTTAPTMTKAQPSAANTMVVTWSEGVNCGATGYKGFTFKPASGSSSTATAISCPGTTKVTLTFPSSTFSEGKGGTLSYDPSKISTTGDRIADLSGNKAVAGSIAITPMAAPIVTAASTTATDFTAVSGDVIVLHFDQDMTQTNTSSMQLLLTDNDGTKLVLACGGDDGSTSDSKVGATCTWTDPDTVEIDLAEATTNSGDVGTAGSFAGLQWPATISDETGWTGSNGLSLNISGSTDVKIDK